jgi:hypothetical protein
MFRSVRTFAAAVLPLFVIVALPSTARAAYICVNPGGTNGCLATIQAAINVAGAYDTVQVAAGTYHEKLVIGQFVPMTINGAGAENTIVDGTGVGDPSAAVIKLSDFSATNLPITITDLTVRGGYRGIHTGRFAVVQLRRLVVRDNGIGSGAGVFNNASFVTISDSVIRDNKADDAAFGCDGSGGSGGGIATLCGGGSYTIVNTAVVNNTARAGGGAVFVNGQQTILNSTFSGNVATDPKGLGGAIMSFADGIFLSNDTFASNTTTPGGGAVFFASAAATVKATIFDNKDGGNCGIGGPVSSGGYNVSSDSTCPFAAAGDLVNTDARLFRLADNGGETLTHALKGDSPALNLVPVTLCGPPATDQRGRERPAGKQCDAGAFERHARDLWHSDHDDRDDRDKR